MNLSRMLVGIAALAISTAASTSGFAQTAAANIDKPVEITFYNYNLASAGNGADATRKMIASFMEKNPNVTVKGIGAPSGEFMTRVQADMAAGQPVDLVQMIFSDLNFAVDNFGAKALEDLVPAAEIQSHLEGMSPNGVKLGQLNGKTYSLAYTFSTPVLFYNADLFRKAGLNPDQPPQTWAEVKEASLAIRKAAEVDGFAMGVFGPTAGDWLYQGVIRSNNGEVISRDRKSVKFAEPEAVEAVEMMRDLAQSGALMNTDITGAMEAMAGGTLGMYLQTSAIQGFLVKGAKDKFDLRATTMPKFGDKPVRPNNSGSGLTILTGDPLKQRAAWELMKHLTSEYGYTIITSEIGYLPLRPAIVNDPKYLKDWVAKNPLVAPNLKQLEVLEPWDSFPGPNYKQISKTMMDAAEMSVFGDVDAATTLRAAQETAQSLMPN